VVERRQLGRGQSPAEGLTALAERKKEKGRRTSRAEVLAAFFVTITSFGASTAAAQTPSTTSQAEPPHVTMYFRDVTRAESWSFFTPPPSGGDPTYALLSNRATLGGRLIGRRIDVSGAFQYAQLLGLPRRAIGPGPLGPGALYYDAARAPNAYQLYFKAFSLRFKLPASGFSLEAGRMGFASGAESASPVEALRAERVAGRMIGEAESTTFERAFDGLRADVNRPRWHVNAALLFPTQGAFEESANPTMEKVRVVAVSATGKRGADATRDSGGAPRSESQVFAYHYVDRRNVRARPDNIGLAPGAVDLAIATFGASHIATLPLAAGELDTVVWLAGQKGDWFDERHRALSLVAEVGYRWKSAWRPWVRAGFSYASGDGDPADGTHDTFFPMLPTAPPSSLAATFAQMNLRESFAELRLTPTPRVTLSGGLRRLSLAESSDLWYSGTGATALRGTYAGYSGRRVFGETDLGTLLDIAGVVPVNRHWTMKSALSTMRGGRVVGQLFAGGWLTVIALESVLRF
jgi:hypothetical protein